MRNAIGGELSPGIVKAIAIGNIFTAFLVAYCGIALLILNGEALLQDVLDYVCAAGDGRETVHDEAETALTYAGFWAVMHFSIFGGQLISAFGLLRFVDWARSLAMSSGYAATVLCVLLMIQMGEYSVVRTVLAVYTCGVATLCLTCELPEVHGGAPPEPW